MVNNGEGHFTVQNICSDNLLLLLSSILALTLIIVAYSRRASAYDVVQEPKGLMYINAYIVYTYSRYRPLLSYTYSSKTRINKIGIHCFSFVFILLLAHLEKNFEVVCMPYLRHGQLLQ